jgi:hypothetical protein
MIRLCIAIELAVCYLRSIFTLKLRNELIVPCFEQHGECVPISVEEHLCLKMPERLLIHVHSGYRQA